MQLCPFVNTGKMHNAFQRHLKPDRLGIDYSKLATFDLHANLPDGGQENKPQK